MLKLSMPSAFISVSFPQKLFDDWKMGRKSYHVIDGETCGEKKKHI